MPSDFLVLLKSAIVRQKWVLLAAMSILLGFWLVQQHTARQGVARSLAEQATSNAVLLHALEDTVVRSFQSVNSSMRTLADGLARPSSSVEVNAVLREQLRTSLQLRAVDVLDADGVVFASVTSALGGTADYACINRLKNEPLTEFVIEAPRQGRYPNDPFAAQSAQAYIPFCVPVHDAQGQLAQVIVASINPEYFYNLFSSVTNSLNSYIHLYRYDGGKLLTTGAVEPDNSAVLQHIKEKNWGQFRATIDAGAYLVSYRSTSLLPFILVLVSDETQALAAWRHDERMMSLFLLVISIMAVVMTLVIVMLREKRWRNQGDIHLLSTAIKSTASAIVITDKHGAITWTNQAFTTLTGYSFAEVKGKNPRILNSGQQQKEFYNVLWTTILSGDSWKGEVVNRHKLGHTLVVEQTITPILDKNNAIEHFVAVHEDVTARKNAEQRALYLADHDSLTSLPNRRYFERYLGQMLTDSERSLDVAVIFINLDRFKDINDSMGHGAGDEFLIHTKNNLQSIMDGNHVLARLGGDEFAILVKKVESPGLLSQFAGQVISAVTKTFYYGEGVFNITCSAGVSTSNSSTLDASTLLRQADMAMYRAKHAGKNTFRFFDEDMDAMIRRRVYLQQQLEKALLKDTALSLRYQPQIDTVTGRVYGAEALMRWEITEGEWVPPSEFITLAEETGQILAVGVWLMRHLFAQMADWNSRGIEYGQISMNISAIQLARDSLAERLLDVMHEYGVSAQQLCIEITETTLMTSSEKVMDNLMQLKQAGIALSIDDFGTGYSSLSYLKAIDASHLKIDRSFIIGIGGDGSDEHIVRATIALAHSLNLKTVAEGVDSLEQLTFLQALSCDYIQGYLFSKPLTAEKFEQYLEQGVARIDMEHH